MNFKFKGQTPAQRFGVAPSGLHAPKTVIEKVYIRGFECPICGKKWQTTREGYDLVKTLHMREHERGNRESLL